MTPFVYLQQWSRHMLDRRSVSESVHVSAALVHFSWILLGGDARGVLAADKQLLAVEKVARAALT
jgi:hypothetical protein